MIHNGARLIIRRMHMCFAGPEGGSYRRECYTRKLRPALISALRFSVMSHKDVGIALHFASLCCCRKSEETGCLRQERPSLARSRLRCGGFPEKAGARVKVGG